MIDYPRWLVARRLEAGLTPAQLAELADLCRSTVSRAEKLGQATPRTRQRVERALMLAALRREPARHETIPQL